MIKHTTPALSRQPRKPSLEGPDRTTPPTGLLSLRQHTTTREEAENITQSRKQHHTTAEKCQYLKTKLESTRRSWRENTAGLNMERDTTRLSRMTKALNDEGTKGQKSTLDEEGRTTRAPRDRRAPLMKKAERRGHQGTEEHP